MLLYLFYFSYTLGDNIGCTVVPFEDLAGTLCILILFFLL